ncbi:Actin cross-linking toxin VgrG1 [Acaryochloris thomasi RCC1774]|uniref:Actin cross-linking toxin VgrG1 n=1 Tax=Acaryochloris thomasi RCC1774 TaxID=1764569 RepID=A0A2W1JD84_9CYAN|nr:VgrG-related protein [Acaryochloris thomasi]PZD71728.1 Actin cross-linking toxin VgrG1 [Acaryochloris thomasi RCC1774]
MPKSKTLYLSEPILKIGGATASATLMKDILEITVDESLHLPSMFVLKVHNVYVPASEDSEEWRNEKYFKLGDSITIGFKGSTTEDPEFKESEQELQLIEGEITGIEVKFSETSEAHLVIRGYDISHRLHRGRHNRSFLNQTESDIVKTVAKEAGIKMGQVDSSGTPRDYTFQENQTNMEFLRERAARIGFELFVQDNKLYFREPKSDGSLSLEWLTDISSFDVRTTTAEQVSSVEVHGWDYSQKKLISEKVSEEQLVTSTGNKKGSSSQVFKSMPSPQMIVVDQTVESSKEAKQMAQALCNELGGEFVTAKAKAEGNPEIRPGKVVKLEKLGTRYSGQYYVTEACHLYRQGVLKTHFDVRGLRQGSLLSTLPPKTHLQPGQTNLVGIVTNNDDPEGWGRVKVKFPTLTEKDESHWARVVGLGAAKERGFYCLPEIDDEVLVAFEHGDIHRPYIIGGVWNGKDKTVETVRDTIQNGKVNLRTIKTRTGHTIQFVEEGKFGFDKGILIETSGGHKVHLNDSDRKIEIRTNGKHQIEMDDNLASKGIDIKTAGRNQVILNDTASTITVKTRTQQALTFSDPTMSISLRTTGLINMMAGGAISLKAGGAVDVKAGGAVNVDAAGAVSVKALGTITATSVGPLNLFSSSMINIGAPSVAMVGVVTANGIPQLM